MDGQEYCSINAAYFIQTEPVYQAIVAPKLYVVAVDRVAARSFPGHLAAVFELLS
jgi:hypothetical protein